MDPGDESSSIHRQIEEAERVTGEAKSEGGRQLSVQDEAVQKGP